MDGMVTTSGGRSAADGFRRRGELDGVAMLHGEHAAAGYGFGEHGAVAGSARAATAETRRELRGDCAAAERPFESRRGTGGLAVISCGQDDVVEAVVDFCNE